MIVLVYILAGVEHYIVAYAQRFTLLLHRVDYNNADVVLMFVVCADFVAVSWTYIAAYIYKSFISLRRIAYKQQINMQFDNQMPQIENT